MGAQRKILILGASYGSLFGTKLLMAGHAVTLVCTPGTAHLINREGTIVRFPIRGRDVLLDIFSRNLPGTLAASAPENVEPEGFDLVVLGMQESQYGTKGVRELMQRIAKARIPSLAIMNMPPPSCLNRIPGLKTDGLQGCYTDPALWDGFEQSLVTLASPDPQAFRPADQPKNILQVSLPTNFKAARFDAEAPTALLKELEADIDAVRTDAGEEVPVKLKVHDSIFVPLAKWPMLITGNYRCITEAGPISIRDAVHGNLDQSKAVYEWVSGLCRGLGAAREDLVPFEKYAKAAEGLIKPASAARALFSGAAHIERVDCLVRRIASQQGLKSEMLDKIVKLVDEKLAKNRGA
jgi:hypothetical protein